MAKKAYFQSLILKLYIKILSYILVTFVVIAFFSVLLLPSALFKDDYSTIILDRHGKLLGAKLASDEQWRFQPSDSIPQRFEVAILAFEDRYFYSHPGINLGSIASALVDNIKAKRIKRGGSTISMQVIRLSRNGKQRTIWQKIIESFLTIGLETTYSKSEILNMYCSNAPFGGNIVGLNAASWRYFGHSDYELSWAEAAVLAVLPNSPSIIHMGRNRELLEKKRNKLLLKLLDMDKIDSIQYRLALLEKIPERVKPLPNIAPHLLSYLYKKHPGEIIETTIDYALQNRVVGIAKFHTESLINNGINNAAIMVVAPKTKEVLAYIGNLSSSKNHKVLGKYNNMIMAKRSTGSILKPFLYAAMIKEGVILPNSLVRDIPSYFNDYHPVNYNNDFYGAVPASKALSQSLNVPAVYMLQEFGVAKFLNLLKKIGFTSFVNSSSHYGLSLILGGGEVSLFELTNAYAGMAKTLLSFDQNYGSYPQNAYSKLHLVKSKKKAGVNSQVIVNKPFSASSIWLTYQALKKVSRPESEAGWESYSSSTKVAWKTGTSHGFKDAWAVGTTPDYVVGVWAGNANSEGRNGLTGTKIAAPIMFDVFNILESDNSFYPPYDELFEVEVCAQSGNLVSPNCSEIDTVFVTEKGIESKVCSYHKIIFTDEKMEFRLSQKCSSIAKMTPVSWFVLPPVQEYYYKKKHPKYNLLPPFADGCGTNSNSGEIDFIYPINNSSIFVVTDENQKKRNIIFEVKHNLAKTTIYWHLNDELIGITTNNHQLPYIPSNGFHKLTVVDELGQSKSVKFNVINK